MSRWLLTIGGVAVFMVALMVVLGSLAAAMESTMEWRLGCAVLWWVLVAVEIGTVIFFTMEEEP